MLCKKCTTFLRENTSLTMVCCEKCSLVKIGQNRYVVRTSFSKWLVFVLRENTGFRFRWFCENVVLRLLSFFVVL